MYTNALLLAFAANVFATSNTYGTYTNTSSSIIPTGTSTSTSTGISSSTSNSTTNGTASAPNGQIKFNTSALNTTVGEITYTSWGQYLTLNNTSAASLWLSGGSAAWGGVDDVTCKFQTGGNSSSVQTVSQNGGNQTDTKQLGTTAIALKWICCGQAGSSWCGGLNGTSGNATASSGSATSTILSTATLATSTSSRSAGASATSGSTSTTAGSLASTVSSPTPSHTNGASDLTAGSLFATVASILCVFAFFL